ncbi:zinc finger protein 469 [Anolis carolinensis]|uniref:C2H2-type domain-containing protein n=1 Tax=Anolis carolinensis TaxID=28377 RepID=A0A803TGA0_ANOCA|nr:PREDICTED: zinc finger protein 469 [Anolis carolinensis]|eukprot:XP_008122845.1 PREDICTED: zinc finger protein 469 [Anolis carolinensis]
MMGETQHAFATEDAGPGAQDKGVSFEPFGKKELPEFDTNGSGSAKEKEPHTQREAVIRPQQTGKIDFKSLQNRPRFPSEGPWGAVKGSPQSPTGKSRGKEKNRRSGKGERGHQQLYRLTISSARPNPTIGIAYPQQKVTPPKKVEAVGRGGHLLGSYRFHVPGLPERDGERQQEELGFARGFADGPSSHISSNYTSPAKVQAPVGAPHDNQRHYLEFQGNGNGTWSSAEKGLSGASSGVFPEGGKAGAHGLGPLSFQYPFQTLHSSAADPFPGSQDYVDVSVVSHGAYAFHPSSRDWKEEALGNGDGGAYGVSAAPLPQFLPPQTHGPLPGYKGRHGHSTDHNGAISPPGAIDPNPSTFPESPAVFPPSLHVSSLPKPLGTRQPLSKDSVASPRILDPGSALRRNTPHVSPTQVHFQNKAYADPNANAVGSLPFDKSLPSALQAHPRLLQPWEGVKKTYSSVEPSSAVYLSSAGSTLGFGCHEPRLKKTWQHLHLTSATPSQNRIELARKLPFPTLEWDAKGQKSPMDYATKALQSGEGAVIQRHDLLPQPCNSANTFCFDGAKDNESPATYVSRNPKSVFFGVGQGVPSSASSRLSSIPGLVLPQASPSESPLPSPAPNATSGSSTCSSLSPASSSPNSFEEGFTLNPPSFFHHQEGNKPFQALETPSCGAFPFSGTEASKDELLYKSISSEGHFPKPNLGCVEAFEAEPPPPPYSSSHHLLASSLSSASLDQLDVFLTCKQCDQNFSNLSSFLEHRQFCSSHAGLHQNQAKDPSRGAEPRKQHHGPPETAKHTQGLLLPLDPHSQLLALNKGDDFLVDGEQCIVKGDAKDDPLKGNALNGIAANPLPLSASDLELDDAKLDSLITEALNGLGYQSDNPEIDSSFIDVFADEELAPSKTKEGFSLGQKAKQVEENGKSLSCYEERPVGDPPKGRTLGHQERSEVWLPVHGRESPELASVRFMDNAEDVDAQSKIRRKNSSHPFVPVKPSKARGSSPTSVAKEPKKQKLRSNTWSKELIHKIVEQKNKLHKLHTKSSKVAPLSCALDRSLPEAKDSKFVEYEYISESDEERVEHAKRHCRRKLGSRMKGRLRSGFGRKRQGRGGREKEKEPAWRCGLRRDRGEEPGRAEDGMDRARRRSSRTSSSSCQATSLTSLTSETSDSTQSTEKADSDTENELQKRVLQNSKQREPSDVAEKEAVGRSRRMSIDLSGDLDSVDSAKLQLGDVNAYQRDISDLLPIPSSKAIHGKGSAMLFGPEAAEQCVKSAGHDSDEPMRKDGEQCRLQGAPRCPPFMAYNGEALKYHTEEFLNPSSVGTQSLPNDENASYEHVDTKCLKKQEFIASIGSFNSNSCDAATIGKGGPKMLVDMAETLYGCKELPDSYESSGLFPQPPAAESSQNSNAYFCHGDIAFKPKHHEILPYEADNDEGKMSSPLSFDSSSVFVAEFDTTLYDGKDSYIPFECAGHPLGKIDQHYPSFLHEKDWSLMEDISPVLPEEISPFHGLSVEKPITKRYLGELHQTPLPERMTDYNVVPFMSSISDDELEIKRLVTELESQLQTSKLQMEEASGEGPDVSKDHPGAEQSDGRFLPLTLDQESDDKGLFLMEDEFGTGNLVAAKSCGCETPESGKTLLSSLDSKYGSHENPWDRPVPFSPLHLAPSAPELILVEPLSSKEERDKIHEDLKDGSDICVGNGFQDLTDTSGQIMPDSSLHGISMEVPSYTSHLVQNPDTLFPKTLVTLPPRMETFPEETFNSAAKLESYQVPSSKSELEVTNGQETDSDLSSSVQSVEERDEIPKSNSPKTRDITACFQKSQDDSVLPKEAMESENQSICQSLTVPSKVNDEESSPSEALAHSKEMNKMRDEYEPALQEKADNPLEQLQLFVARTVKNNEEDLLAPCFSILHPNTHLLPSTYIQATQKEELQDNVQSEDITGSPMVEKRKRSLGEEAESVAKESDPPEFVLEQGKIMEHVSYATMKAVTQSPGCDFAERERQQKERRFEDEHPEEGDIDTCAGGVSPEHNNLSPLGNQRDEGAQEGQVTGEMEEDLEKAALAFRSHEIPGSLENETTGSALVAVLTVCNASWDKVCSEGQGKAFQVESDGEETPEGQLSSEVPELEDTCLQHGTGFCSVSAKDHGVKKKNANPHGNTCLDCFSSTAGIIDPKDLQRNNMGSMASNVFERLPSEEVHSKIPPGNAEKSLAGDPMQQNGESTFTAEHYGATSPQALQPCHTKDKTLDSVGSQKGTTMPSVSSPSSIDVASLIETERAMELHMDEYKSNNVLPLEYKDLPCSEEVPKSRKDSEMCCLREASSQQVIAFGQSPSKVDSALPVDSRTKENILKPQEKTYIQADQTQPEVNKVDIQEMPIVHRPEATNKNESHFNDGQILEIEENGSQNGGHGLEKEDCKQTGDGEDPSGFVEQEKHKGGRLGDPSKTGTETTKKRKGSPATCDICSVSFRSKTGLMRHKAVKHLSTTEDALLPACVPLEKELKVSKKNRKLPMREKARNSPTGLPFPKSYKNQRGKPKRETQGDVGRKGLGDLNGVSSDSACELQSPSKEREGELVPRREANAGEEEREARTDKLESLSGKKVKGKARKVKAKGVSNQKIFTPNSQLEIDIPALGSDVVSTTTDVILTVSTIKKDLEDSPISTEQSTSLPCPSRVKELEAVDERSSSAKETTEEKLLQDVENTKEQVEDPDGKECLEKDSSKESEQESSPCEGTSGKELEMKENLLEQMMDRNPNSPLGCALTGPQQPCQVGATEKDFPKDASSDGAPCLEDPQPWRSEEFPPKDESQDRSIVGPDLFDDDFTFSQLFPRHDQFARRKCRRVYGKRIKKPKPVAEVATRPEGTADLFSTRMASDLGETSSFCVTREDPCEYDTIYIDDALMLNMCHGSKPMLGDVMSGSTKRMTGLRDEVAELENGGMLSLLCQKSPTSDLPSLASWTSLEKKGDDVPADEASLNPSMELTDGHLTVGDSPEPPDLEEEPYETRINDNPCSPALHTIDMETPNTREVCFYSAGEDHLSCTDNESTLGFKPASVLQGRPSKNKLEEGKPGKNRSDLNLKTKDKQYKCKVCFQWFLTLGELDFHKLSHNPSPPPTCYMCVQRKFSSREQLRDHLKEKHAKNKAGLWACGMCLKEISDVWMYNEHLREHATQFARKGQAQKSVLGLPDCFGEEDPAVAQFLNSIMCRKPSKASKNPEVQTCKERKVPKEPLGQEAATVNKESLEIPCRTKPPVASPKAPPAPSPDPAPKVETAQKLAPMHPECKDPSRDCHHCGKQFPKPFKLQRHLVVHSLQKIYLCHKCPMFYQETKELRSHLSQEHGAAEEADIKHTTLYACELCADVMHVIKKSFICSTCNYTFSKKEQYDRHMEKHLVGSSRTFRFRGVMRPGASAKEGDKAAKEEKEAPKEEVPLAKKKRVGHQNSSLAPGTQDLQLEGEPLLPLGPLSRHHSSTMSQPSLSRHHSSTASQPPLSRHHSSTTSQPSLSRHHSSTVSQPPLSRHHSSTMSQPPLSRHHSSTASPPETPMNTEGLLDNFSNLLTETKTFLFDSLPSDASLVPQDELSHPEGLGHVSSLSEGHQSKRDTVTDYLSPSFESSNAVRLDLTSSSQKTAQKQSHLPEKRSKETVEKAAFNAEDATGTWENLRGEGKTGATGCSPDLESKKEPKTRCHISEAQPEESVVKPHLPEALPLKDKTASPVQNQSPSKKFPLGENPSGLQCLLDEEDEGQKQICSKDKATRDTSAVQNCPGVGTKEAGNKLGKLGHSDSGKCLAKPHPKKRKEHKAAHKSGSRENIEGDGGKKKKVRTQDNTGGDGDLKRPEWPSGEGLALTSRRGDAHCNKLSPKVKVSVVGGGQLKKAVLEPCFPKKANADVKRKKDILVGKALHPLLGKSDPSGHGFHHHRQRALQGAKLSDSHNYRTAESQNNLLSQLFGQKLTSFKIPLRRDPSE